MKIIGTNEEQKKLKKKKRMKQWACSFDLGFLKSRGYILVVYLPTI